MIISFKCKSEIYKEMNSKETSLFKENSVFNYLKYQLQF